MRTQWIGLLGSLVLLAAGAAATAVRADQGPKVRGTNFFSDCRFSHAAPDDPIVHPGMRRFSHPHQFFGNVSTNASSTLATLLAHGTSCNRKADTAAYWVPALYRHGQVVKPLGVSVYYQIRSLGWIRPFPAGLKVVAGDAAARTPQSTRIVFWNCAYPPGPTKHVPSPPMCPRGRPRMIAQGRETAGHLRLNINFPDCWDGRRLDSAHHQSHMAYSVALRCPASYPVKVPALRLTVIYPIRGGSDLALSSGGLYSGHADFFNAWNERELARLVAACAAEAKHCSRPPSV